MLFHASSIGNRGAQYNGNLYFFSSTRLRIRRYSGDSEGNLIMDNKFIKVQALYNFLAVEPFILLGCLMAVAWLFYKFFLKEASDERHRIIRGHFQTLMRYYMI